jgi:hypothetical protein
MCIKFYKCVNEATEQLYFGFIARSKSFSSCSLVKLDYNKKNSLKSYDDSTSIRCINSEQHSMKFPRKSRKSVKFPRKSRKSPKKLFSKSKKSNRRIHSQIQDRTPTSRDIDEFQNHREKLSKFKNRELPSGSVYFLNIFEQNFFLVNHHETDFSLVFYPLRARTSTPPDTQPPFCEGKENVFKKSKSQSRNVKVKIKNNRDLRGRPQPHPDLGKL